MHPIKRGILVAVLSLGAIGGFSHGFARMAQCHESCGASRRDQFEEHISDVCTRSAERVYDQQATPPATPPPSTPTLASLPSGYVWAIMPVAALHEPRPAPVYVLAPTPAVADAPTAPITE